MPSQKYLKLTILHYYDFTWFQPDYSQLINFRDITYLFWRWSWLSILCWYCPHWLFAELWVLSKLCFLRLTEWHILTKGGSCSVLCWLIHCVHPERNVVNTSDFLQLFSILVSLDEDIIVFKGLILSVRPEVYLVSADSAKFEDPFFREAIFANHNIINFI